MGDLVFYGGILKKDGYDVRGAFSGSRDTTKGELTQHGRLFCLPDTVDPRGPKGK